MRLYDTLMTRAEADERELRTAYRAAVRRWHPDRDSSDAAALHFLAVQRAWHVLGDPARRASYDAAVRSDHAAPARVVFVRRKGPVVRLRRWLRRRRQPHRSLR